MSRGGCPEILPVPMWKLVGATEWNCVPDVRPDARGGGTARIRRVLIALGRPFRFRTIAEDDDLSGGYLRAITQTPARSLRASVLGRLRRLFVAVALGLLAAPQTVFAQEIVITFGGDVNFARSRQAPDPTAVNKFGTVPKDETTRNLAPLWDGDVNFINVETVVSERDGTPDPAKSFVFRSHPESFRHLVRLGVNAFSLANNHSYDHGWQGLEDTADFFRSTDRPDHPLLFAGVGKGEQAFAPKIVTIRGIRIAMGAASFGSGSFAPSKDRVGMTYLTREDHYQAVLDGLRLASADLKILSLHYGTENLINLNVGQIDLFRRGLEEAGVNLVLGHHPHVVRGVEALPERGQAIFYSLGNLLFIGGAQKDSSPLGFDYGLLGRAYFYRTRGEWRISALEATPLKGVHHIPHTLSPERTVETLRHLNRLSERSVGDRAVSFTVSNFDSVHGLACFAQPWGPRAKIRCCKDVSERNLQCDLPDSLM